MKKPLVLLLLSAFPLIGYAQITPPENLNAYGNLLKAMATIDANDALRGKTTVVNYDVNNTVSAQKLLDDYANNELAANKKYKAAKVRVTGKAEKIGEDAFGNAFVDLKGKALLQYVHLYVSTSDEYVVKLNKGDNVDMVCQIQSYVLNTPSLNSCVESGRYYHQFALSKMPEKFDPADKRSLFVLLTYRINQPVWDNTCVTSVEACVKAINAFRPTQQFLDDLKKNDSARFAQINDIQQALSAKAK